MSISYKDLKTKLKLPRIMTRLLTLFFAAFVLMNCGTSSVYQMSDEEQHGLTYQLYQEDPSQAFEETMGVLRNHVVDRLTGKAWQIVSSNVEEGRIETNWRERDTPDAGGIQSMGGGSNERYRIIAEISESNSGSRVFFQLEKQVRFSEDPESIGQWQMYEVTVQDTRSLLNPVFEELEEGGLTPQD
jgi:hypothetical protein